MASLLKMLSGSSVLPEATGQVIEYIRKPNEFAINTYAQYVETPLPQGMYAYVDPDQPVRIVNEAEFAWEDGDARPTGNANLLSYQWIPFRTYRRDYPWTLGNQAIESTKDFSKMDPAVQEAGQVASQAMTNRTNRVITMLQTAGNWGNNTADANTLNGGRGPWSMASSDPTSPNYLAIKRSIDAMMLIINLSTNARVKRSKCMLILSPGAARVMGETSEIYDYVKYGASGGLKVQEGDDRDYDEDWGLPAKIYGLKVCVEDSPICNTYPVLDATTHAIQPASISTGARSYVKNDTTAIIVTRIGGIEGAYGSPSFSTVQIYFYGAPMQVEQFPDKKNRRTEGHVSETFFEVVAAPASGGLITNIM